MTQPAMDNLSMSTGPETAPTLYCMLAVSLHRSPSGQVAVLENLGLKRSPGIHKSEDPVSKTTETTCPGVPISISPKYCTFAMFSKGSTAPMLLRILADRDMGL